MVTHVNDSRVAGPKLSIEASGGNTKEIAAIRDGEYIIFLTQAGSDL
jgi:hypothetical protein